MNDLTETYNALCEAYQEFKQQVRQLDSHLFERWKAGGFLIDSDIISDYPNAEEVFELLEDNEETYGYDDSLE